MLKEGPEEVPVERRKSSSGIEIDTGGGAGPRSRCLCPREATEHEVGRACSTCRSGLLQKTSAGKRSHGRFVKRFQPASRPAWVGRGGWPRQSKERTSGGAHGCLKFSGGNG